MAEQKNASTNSATTQTIEEIVKYVKEDIKGTDVVECPIQDAIEDNFYITLLLHLFLRIGNDIVEFFFIR